MIFWRAQQLLVVGAVVTSAVCDFVFSGGAMSTELEDMTAENSTNTVMNLDTKTAAFFDPASQLVRTIDFYFQYALIVLGVFGMAANALVLYAIIAYHLREIKKRQVNLLMINQNLLDLSFCILAVISFSIKVSNIYLTGALGYFLCTIFISENATNCMLLASIINLTPTSPALPVLVKNLTLFLPSLASMRFVTLTIHSIINLMTITVERYLKVVHPFSSKKNLKRWMIYAAMAFAWIAGILSYAPAVFISTIVHEGMCMAFYLWESMKLRMTIFSYWFNFSYFLVPVIMFIFCYGRIVAVMRRQMKVMAAHNVEGSAQMSASQVQSKRIKWNIIKTMIIVSVSR